MFDIVYVQIVLVAMKSLRILSRQDTSIIIFWNDHSRINILLASRFHACCKDFQPARSLGTYLQVHVYNVKINRKWEREKNCHDRFHKTGCQKSFSFLTFVSRYKIRNFITIAAYNVTIDPGVPKAVTKIFKHPFGGPEELEKS